MTLHVAILFEFPTLNGGEQSMLSVLRHLKSESSLRFTAIAPPDGPLAAALSGLSISHQPFSLRGSDNTRRPTAQLLDELADLAIKLNVQLLHANSLSMSRLTGQLRRSCPLVCTGHLRDIMKLKNKVISDLNNNNGLVAVSNAVKDFHVSQGLPSKQCHVIYNGVDTIQFQPRVNQSVRNTLLSDVPADAKVLLNVGQICLRKGQLDLARSVCPLTKSRPELHLVLVGERHSAKQESIEYERAIRTTFSECSREAHLHMPGFQNQIPQLMNAAHMLVHSARQEPFGRVLLEAAACGLPIIATDVGGTHEMLRHGKEALLVQPDNSREMTTAIETLLSDPQLADRLSAAARSRITERFNVRQAAEALRQFWLSSSQSESVSI